MKWTFIVLVIIGLLTAYFYHEFQTQDSEEDDKHSTSSMHTNHTGFIARHLMTVVEDVITEFNDLAPDVELEYWLSGDFYPHNIDGGSELTYNWVYRHSVEKEYTNMSFEFEVDVPYLTLFNDSVIVYLFSWSMDHNYTEIENVSVQHFKEEEKIKIIVDISEPMWINLTKPWKRPDCWWTPFKDCYETDYTDCVFMDMSDEQNWNASSCYTFNILDCLPFNTTSECHYLNTTACLMTLLEEADDPSSLLCPVQHNTSCVQVNDRGLYYAQYDWTIPVEPTMPPFIVREFCDMTTEQVWISEVDLNGTIYAVEIFLSEDLERNCRSVLMKPRPGPTTPIPTYNPYKELPSTDQYMLARDCLNVNTSGMYEVYIPIDWMDFNLSVSFSGVMSNFMEVNTQFVSVLTANITQPTKPLDINYTGAVASVEYWVKKPYVRINPVSTFSEPKFVLKHELVNYHGWLVNPEAYNYGVKLTISVDPVDDQLRMTFLNGTLKWSVGRYLIASIAINGSSHDDEGNLLVSAANISEVIKEERTPEVIEELYAEDGGDILDRITLTIEPFFNVWDNKYNGHDMVRLWFDARVLTDVTPDMELPVTASAVYFHVPNGDYTTKHTKKLTVTDQPFVPLIPPLDLTQHPDTGDDIIFTFDLSQILEHHINDTWMNVSCPDLRTVNNTMELDFYEPVNITDESDYDQAFLTETTYHIHLKSLFPEVNFHGNQTFHFWDNSMVTHQEIVCNIMLSYRLDDAALVIPYVAGESPALTTPGISYELYRIGYGRGDEGNDTDVYGMPVGSNVTYILNITFPELTTKLDVTYTMPVGVLAVYYSLIDWQGSQLISLDINDTVTSVEPGDDDIRLWEMSTRTVTELKFGNLRNLADNEETIDDNLILEFNLVLLDNPALVTRDEEHTFQTTVQYTNGPDLEQTEEIIVLEPEITMSIKVANKSQIGDPGDVFQYYLHLSHVSTSQSPAHHILVQIYLPYMEVYQDFKPLNSSRVPDTRTILAQGENEADDILELYLYKLGTEEVIEGTFLIQVSIKLTRGVALQARMDYEMYSFYQWGRIYTYANVSDNVINIRNASLHFAGTSQPETPDVQVTIHEQATYRVNVPLPPIPVNLTILVDLPRYVTVMKTWKIQQLRKAIPDPPPIEQVYYEEGCLVNKTVVEQGCVCYDSLSGDGTFHAVYPDWILRCFDVPKLNCSRGDQNGGIDEGNVTTSNTSCTALNGTQDQNATNSTACSDNSASNLTANHTDIPEVPAVEICHYTAVQYQMCVDSMTAACDLNANLTELWEYVPDFIICNETDDIIVANATLNGTGNWTRNLNSTLNVTGNWTLNLNTTLNPPTVSPTMLPENSTSGNATTTPASPTDAPYSTPGCVSLKNGGLCRYFAQNFCDASALRVCPVSIGELRMALYNGTVRMRKMNETFVNNTSGYVQELIEDDKNVMCACQHLEPPPVPVVPVNETVDPYDACANRSEPVYVSTTPVPTVANNTGNATLGINATIAPTTSAPELLLTTATHDICEEEEMVLFGMAAVVSTTIYSSREGAVCYFVGGNRHDPFNPGVTYFTEFLPAKATDVSDSVNVEVTYVVLDHPELSRGSTLELNATSIFTYITKPIPPSSIFRENCTCSKLLSEYFQPENDRNCTCETVYMTDVPYEQCRNCTSLYPYEDDGYEYTYSCNCINFCRNNTDYFLNPPTVANLKNFSSDLCDCESLEATLAENDPEYSLLDHVENCMETNPFNYTCRDLTYTETHHDLPMTDMPCTCQEFEANVLTCNCSEQHITDVVEDRFAPLLYDIVNCSSAMDDTVGQLEWFQFGTESCTCDGISWSVPTTSPPPTTRITTSELAVATTRLPTTTENLAAQTTAGSEGVQTTTADQGIQTTAGNQGIETTSSQTDLSTTNAVNGPTTASGQSNAPTATSSSQTNPSTTTAVNAPTTIMDAPTTAINSPTTGSGQSNPQTTSAVNTSTSLSSQTDPPTTTAVNAPTTVVNAPTTVVNAPTTAMDAPTTAMDAPTTAMDDPTTAMDDPTTAMDDPTTANGQSYTPTISADPTTTTSLNNPTTTNSLNNPPSTHIPNVPTTASSLNILTTSPGVQTTTPGVQTTTPGIQTTTPGVQTTTPGVQTTTLGVQTTTPGVQTTTPGVQTTTPGVQTTTPGVHTTTPGLHTTTPGFQTTTPGVHTTTPGLHTTTPGLHTTTPGIVHTTTAKPTTEAPAPPVHQCSCNTVCLVKVEQHCDSDSTHSSCSDVKKTDVKPLEDSKCECLRKYHRNPSLDDVLAWYREADDVLSDDGNHTAAMSANVTSNSSFVNESDSNINSTCGSNYTTIAGPTIDDYVLDCNCFDVGKYLTHVHSQICEQTAIMEDFECSCLVPPDNETQFILDHWDYNLTFIDYMITELAHMLTVVEPELQITFTRNPDPSIVDSIDEVDFHYEISHTEMSNAPAYNLTLQLDAINFTINGGVSALSTETHCTEAWLCDASYNNAIGRFHIPLLPVDPPGVIFSGTYRLSVGNHIDFVANSLIVATGIAWYDSCVIDFVGRLYDDIVAYDTVQIDAPTISADLVFTTAYAYAFFSSSFGVPPQTFSIGDIIRMEAKLWVPEITLHLANFSIQGVLPNMTTSSGQIKLSERIYHRNDTDSVFVEMEDKEVDQGGTVYPGQVFDNARFLEDGVTTVPGVIVNNADNISDTNDYVTEYFTFRIQDVPYWGQDVQIPWTISAIYYSDYTQEQLTLVDETITLTVVEPKLTLRVEILDHFWQRDQVMHEAGYTCDANDCCVDEPCDTGKICVTDTANIGDCASKQCRCHSGYSTNELDTCTAVGQTAGDIINFGLTTFHDPAYTGNAFDVFIHVSTDLPSDLVIGGHFFRHPGIVPGDYVSSLTLPVLTQLDEHRFQLYIKRFTYEDMCERFVIPHRIRPEVVVYPAQMWGAMASMWYYSAKPYDIPPELNTKSRYYMISSNITFNFTSPVPSTRFSMIPPTGGSSAIDFNVYSSSDESHVVTVNLREETEVKFLLEMVVPKIKCDITIMLALPEGEGFTFESIRIVEMGSRIIFPYSKLSNDSLTENLRGSKYFFAELPEVYSVPNLINSQRLMNSTIQKQFKTMHGDQQPYPADPECYLINATAYERHLLRGCFHDNQSFFDVAVATANHSENYNYSLAMTRKLCHKLCMSSDYYISGTKNGSDCYCTNYTGLQSYYDHGSVLYHPMNITYLVPYQVTVYYPCNKTRPIWTNLTFTGNCRDRQWLKTCVKDCHTAARSNCMADFEAKMSCSSLAALQCLLSFNESIGGNATAGGNETTPFIGNVTGGNMTTNSSNVTDDNVGYNSTCWNAVMSECQETQDNLCRSLSDNMCTTDTPEYATCVESAIDIYRTTGLASCIQALNETCVYNQWKACFFPMKYACQDLAAEDCIDIPVLDPEYGPCFSATFDPCYSVGSPACDRQAEGYCAANMTYPECYLNETTRYNVTVEECVIVQLDACTACLSQIFVNCTDEGTEGRDECYGIAVQNCTLICTQSNCTSRVQEELISYAYENCTWVDSSMITEMYLGNCSREEERWRNVTETIMDPRPIPMDLCNVSCTGNDSITCGSEDFVIIYGALEGSLVEQQCDWYAGLYDDTEDVFTIELTMSIEPLLTKGITEYLQPYVAYIHGEEKIPTILPLAPYRLEAGIVQLDMYVYVSPKTQGFLPGNWIEYYTELYHNPLSTITARDVSIVWMFPTYVEYVNLTNHELSLRDYNQLQPVTAASTDPAQRFRFTVPTLRNRDMISFHFRILLDPQHSLPQGEYNMMAFAEAYYYTWDLYNPHEDEFKHNVVLHTHNVLPTQISFEVPTTYVARPELDDLKLSTYSVLYDEVHNILYACFYNNTVHIHEGGCYMVGDLPAYPVDRPPTCDEFCNCTYFWDLPADGNCTMYEPKPDNCTCGCVPDCMEDRALCKESCYNCTTCYPSETLACSADCDQGYQNCTQDCCVEDCYPPLDSCLNSCTNCTNDWNCTVDTNCTHDCSLLHGDCVFTCLIPPNTCTDNCTDVVDFCLEDCEEICLESDLVYIPGISRNCSEICTTDCLDSNSECTIACCSRDCVFNHTICHMDCQFSCGDDTDCLGSCAGMCNNTFVGCMHVCSPPKIPCHDTCNSAYSFCGEYCVAGCITELCTTDDITANNESISNNITSSPDGLPSSNQTDHCSNSTGEGNCTGTAMKCENTLDDACFSICHTECQLDYKGCDTVCCLEQCARREIGCLQNCTYGCRDEDCVHDCRFYCLDVVDNCTVQCNLPDVLCRDVCELDMESCDDVCLQCEDTKNLGISIGNGTFNGTFNETDYLLNYTIAVAELEYTDIMTNASSCSNNGTVNGTAVCANETETIEPTQDPICVPSLDECLDICNGTHTDCAEDCPCDETCYLDFSTCRMSCAGCREKCFDKCEHNCSLDTQLCEYNCVVAFKTPNQDCASNCITHFDACSKSCKVKLYTTVVIEYLDQDCLDDCAQETFDCLEPCHDAFITQNCTEKCETVTLYCTDTCLNLCNESVASCNTSRNDTGVYKDDVCVSNTTCFNTCFDNCTFLQSLTTSAINTSYVSNETYSRDNSTTNSTRYTNKSTDNTNNSTFDTHISTTVATTEATTTPSNVIIFNSTSIAPFNSSNINATLPPEEELVICNTGCVSEVSQELAECSLKCSTNFTTCLAVCAECNTTDCPIFFCTEACSRSLETCTVGCLQQESARNCSDIVCAGRDAECMLGCEICNSCRDECRDDCIGSRESCLGICFPKTCGELHTDCVQNCSTNCDCQDACSQNCTGEQQHCTEPCSVASLNSCYQGGFTDCLDKCVSPIGNSSDEVDCMQSCTLQYSNCTGAEMTLVVNMCPMQNCTDSFILYNTTNIITNATNMVLSNVTDSALNNSTNVTFANNSTTLVDNSTTLADNSTTLANNSTTLDINSTTPKCNIDTCTQSYLNFTVCHQHCGVLPTLPTVEVNATCNSTCLYELYRDSVSSHHNCTVECFEAHLVPSCLEICDTEVAVCNASCTNCTLCPMCVPDCDLDLVECKAKLTTPSPPTIMPSPPAHGDNDSLSLTVPDCTVYQNCLSNCNRSINATCSNYGDYAAASNHTGLDSSSNGTEFNSTSNSTELNSTSNNTKRNSTSNVTKIDSVTNCSNSVEDCQLLCLQTHISPNCTSVVNCTLYQSSCADSHVRRRREIAKDEGYTEMIGQLDSNSLYATNHAFVWPSHSAAEAQHMGRPLWSFYPSFVVYQQSSSLNSPARPAGAESYDYNLMSDLDQSLVVNAIQRHRIRRRDIIFDDVEFRDRHQQFRFRRSAVDNSTLSGNSTELGNSTNAGNTTHFNQTEMGNFTQESGNQTDGNNTQKDYNAGLPYCISNNEFVKYQECDRNCSVLIWTCERLCKNVTVCKETVDVDGHYIVANVSLTNGTVTNITLTTNATLMNSITFINGTHITGIDNNGTFGINGTIFNGTLGINGTIFNGTAYIHGLNITTNSSMDSSTSVEQCTTVSLCMEECTGNCTNLCNGLRPIQHRDCYQECDDVSAFCVSNCSVCHHNGTATNCTSECDDLCDLPQGTNKTECYEQCDSIANFDNCTASCYDVQCLDRWNCQCNCTCTEHETVSANEECASFETTNGSLACNLTDVEETCLCQCGCVEGNFLPWRALHPSVGNLLGIDVSDNTLYGLSSHGLAVLRSRTYGETWKAITMAVWTQARMADTFIDSVNLQEEDGLVTFLEPEEQMVFASGIWNDTWGVSGTGVHHQDIANSPLWRVFGTWSCCKESP